MPQGRKIQNLDGSGRNNLVELKQKYARKRLTYTKRYKEARVRKKATKDLSEKDRLHKQYRSLYEKTVRCKKKEAFIIEIYQKLLQLESLTNEFFQSTIRKKGKTVDGLPKRAFCKYALENLCRGDFCSLFLNLSRHAAMHNRQAMNKFFKTKPQELARWKVYREFIRTEFK